ncbi:hypothetical protein [Streptomyces sp. SPB4]|uniref:hypothetical protein n=1 Tax=Streptomyces sp. SPB4 TaxID=2940553 RepID=UPI002474C7FC|nr:hypothetical protein [Streptomyces sp. SPB4]MDH6545548.1 hypothetical protein [Streptomyces sp. SPB4]
MSRTRGAWNTKAMWVAGVALAGVVILTGYAAIGGDEGKAPAPAAGASPGASGPAPGGSIPTYLPPKDWDEPQRWVALPRGERTDEQASQVGFPHTTEGAAAMMAAAHTISVGEGKTNVTEQLRTFNSYISKSDHTAVNAAQVERSAREGDKTLAQELGVAEGVPLPQGAYLRVRVIGYKVVKQSNDEVSVWLLTRAMQKAGETAKESGGYATTLSGAQWQDGDWKVTLAASSRAVDDTQGKPEPDAVAPGDEAFNRAGWTAIRAAS